ncbi:MAG: DegT/DnrJ/EryC1/StrS family aminotransferase, partial [Desulfomonile tiedjei]|nr:DegT/DnrJ/EryC1/StrS family aminotransferase [Desulfomonile tiedjei]
QEAVKRVLESGWVSMGPETELFESEFAAYLGSKNAAAVSSGTTALHLALLAAGVGPGDEVITPSLTFVATANAILYVGATPVFADVTGVEDWNISADQIERAITSKTKAVILVHYAGFPCQMDTIRELAESSGLVIIEDAAHAPGAEFQSRKIGTWGKIGCFSFFSNKNMTTAEGGMVVTDDPETAKKLKVLRSHGMTTLTWDRHRGHSFSYDVIETGYNYRMDEIRAALGRVQLAKLEANNQKRRLATLEMRRHLKEYPEISVPFSDKSISDSSCHIFPILLEESELRPGLMAHLKNAGIQTSIHYPPVHRFSTYLGNGRARADGLRITEEIAAREVTLPLFPQILPGQIKSICRELRGFFDHQGTSNHGRTLSSLAEHGKRGFPG